MKTPRIIYMEANVLFYEAYFRARLRSTANVSKQTERSQPKTKIRNRSADHYNMISISK
jgi:hypothetical protein